MFQETIAVTQDAATVEKAINFGAVAMNILVMTLGSFVIIAVYALKSVKTPVATIVWVRENMARFIIGLTRMVALAVLLVVSPDISNLFQAIGFNVDKSPLALGISIGLLMIGATSEPSKNPEGK